MRFGCPLRFRISLQNCNTSLFSDWKHHFQPLVRGCAVKIFSQTITEWLNDWITEVFVEQTWLRPGLLKTLGILISSAHSWFKLVMNTLIASIRIGFQVTISKSLVQMTSNLFPLSKIGQLWISTFHGLWWSNFGLKTKEKSSEIDLQDIGESPRDPLLQQAAHMRLTFLQRNMIIYTKIYHKNPMWPQQPPHLRGTLFPKYDEIS